MLPLRTVRDDSQVSSSNTFLHYGLLCPPSISQSTHWQLFLSQMSEGAGDWQLRLRLRSVARHHRHQLIKGSNQHLLLSVWDSSVLRKRSTVR